MCRAIILKDPTAEIRKKKRYLIIQLKNVIKSFQRINVLGYTFEEKHEDCTLKQEVENLYNAMNAVKMFTTSNTPHDNDFMSEDGMAEMYFAFMQGIFVD